MLVLMVVGTMHELDQQQLQHAALKLQGAVPFI
jgi:hypothetical protein